MADTRKYPGVKAARLTAGVSSGDTTMTLSAIEDRQGNTLTMTDFGSKGYAVVDPGGTNEEYVVFTGISSTTVSGISTQSATASYAETSGFANAHAAGVKVILMTNSPGFYDTFANKNNDETILKTWTFTSTEIPIFDSDPTLTDDKHIATKKYVDDVALSGAPDATETVKGNVELATIAELSAGTATGGTSANLVAHAEDFGNTSSAKQMVPVTDADGDIPVEFMELDANWTFTGDVDITASKWKLGSTAFTGSMANLNEAATFFGATDITGAEAEDLTDGTVVDENFHSHESLLASAVNHTATASTSEQTICTYTLPAGQLGTKHGIRFKIALLHSANQNGDNTVIKFKYGSTAIATVTLTGAVGATDRADLDCIVVNTATDAQSYGVIGREITTPTTDQALCDASGTAAVDTSGAIAVSVSTTTLDGTNPVIVRFCTIEYLYAT